MRIGSLCSGFGGLELAVEALWPGAEVAWHSEVDPWASKVLAAHWPEVPNLGDLTTVDWASVQPVDVLTAGFPCQPVSSAGRRAGVDDKRWLFDDIATAVGVLRPRLVLLENVRGLLSANGGAAMGRVVHGLARVGYVGRYGLLRASDVGACHRRERVFIVAYPAQPDGPSGRRNVAGSGPSPVQGAEVDERAPVESRRRYGSDRPELAVATADAERLGGNWGGAPGPSGWLESPNDRGGIAIADTDDCLLGNVGGGVAGEATSRQRADQGDGRRPADRRRGTPADAGVERLDGRQAIEGTRRDSAVRGEACDHARHGAASCAADAAPPDAGSSRRQAELHVARSTREGVSCVGGSFGAYQPAINRWANVIGRPALPGLDSGRLNARFVEWMQGLDPGWVTDVVPRRHALRILGNGVVSLQAATAYRMLLS